MKEGIEPMASAALFGKAGVAATAALAVEAAQGTNYGALAVSVTLAALGSLICVFYRMNRAQERDESYAIVDGLFCVLAGTALGALGHEVLFSLIGLAAPVVEDAQALRWFSNVLGGIAYPYLVEKWLRKLQRDDDK